MYIFKDTIKTFLNMFIEFNVQVCVKQDIIILSICPIEMHTYVVQINECLRKFKVALFLIIEKLKTLK